MKTAFIITSALNTRFGVYSATDRFVQTVQTVRSIKQRVPDPYIILVEMAGEPITPEQKQQLQAHVNLIVDYSTNKTVQEIYKNPNWDVVKSTTEMLCFGATLLATADKLKDVDRIFKLSGRYELNNNFNLADHNNDKIIFAQRKQSQFPPQVTNGQTEQFMSRLWSFPRTELAYIIATYPVMSTYMKHVVKNSGYIDIEHLLCKFIDPNKIIEVPVIGVKGHIGPNGVKVND